MCRYSVRRITDGACMLIRCERNMCPLCSSIRATPLKILTTARRSVHTLIGSNEAFRTRTRAFMVRAILRERYRECQKTVSEGRNKGGQSIETRTAADKRGYDPSLLILIHLVRR